MSLKQWADNRWILPHKTSPREIADLLTIVERDLNDAEAEISADGRFGFAYNAALKLCTVLLYASGYRPEKLSAHHRTITSLPLILGPARKDDTDYLDACRDKRNTADYDMAGVATREDAAELAEFTKQLREDVLAWLKKNHPHLVPTKSK